MPPKVNIEQEEQKIFKEFEKLGYSVCYNKNDVNILALYNNKQGSTINVFADKTYSCRYTDITVKEHQLLHKLFELWGWFDE